MSQLSKLQVGEIKARRALGLRPTHLADLFEVKVEAIEGVLTNSVFADVPLAGHPLIKGPRTPQNPITDYLPQPRRLQPKRSRP